MNGETTVKEQPLQTIEPQAMVAPTPMDLMQAAIASGVDADQLGKLMDLQDRYEANIAKKAYFKSMSKLQAELPIIFKNKRGDKSTYAPLEQIMDKIRPILDRHGFSVRFDVDPTEGESGSIVMLTAFCYVTHVLGHSEKNHFAVPVDLGPINQKGSRVMNGPQATASARSYAKRYALGDALNLVFGDEDDDGDKAGKAYITDEQVITLNDYIESLGDRFTAHDRIKWFEYLKANSVKEIHADRFDVALTVLQRKAI